MIDYEAIVVPDKLKSGVQEHTIIKKLNNLRRKSHCLFDAYPSVARFKF